MPNQLVPAAPFLRPIENLFRLHLHIALVLSLALPVQLAAQAYPIKVNRLWGMIDREGKLVASPEYDAIFRTGTDHAVAVREGKYGLLSQDGGILIEPQFTFLRELNDALVLTNQGADCSSGNCEGGKWGVVNLEQGNRLPPQFDFIEEFDSLGWARVNVGGDCNGIDCEGGKWGVVDENANLILKPFFLSVSWANNDEIFIQTKEGWGLYDPVEGAMTIRPRFKSLKRVGPNRLAMELEGKFGVVDNTGKPIIDPHYDDIKDGKQGFLAFQLGEKYGLMDSLGRILVEARYVHIEKGPFQWVYAHNERWALVDTFDREIVGPVLTEIGDVGAGYAAVRRGATWGVVDSLGKYIVPSQFEELTVVDDTTFMVVDRSFYKWYSPAGTIRRVIQLDAIETFEFSVARVRKKSRWGLINIRGEWLMPPKYASIARFETVASGRWKGGVDYCNFDENGAITPVRSFVVMREEEEEFDPTSLLEPSQVGWFLASGKELWGLRPAGSGRTLIQPTYERVRILPNTDLSLAFEKGQGMNPSGGALINHKTGQIVTQAIFRDIYFQDWENGEYARAVYSASGQFTLVNQRGQTVDLGKVGFMGEWKNNVSRVNIGGAMTWGTNPGLDTLNQRRSFNNITQRTEDSYQYCVGGKWGFVDRAGKWVVEPKFDMALDFKYGISRVKNDSLWGAVDQNFQLTVQPAYDYIQYLDSMTEGVLLAVGRNTGGYGFMDELGELAIQPQFQQVGEFHDGLVRIQEKGLWGFADTSGTVVIPPQYREVGDFSEGRARFRNRRYWGYINRHGEVIVPESYLRAGDFHGGLAWIQQDKFYGFIGLDGQIVIDPAFSKAGDFWEGLAPARRKGNWGLIGTDGKWVLAPNFYRVQPFRDSLAIVQQKADFGIIDRRGDFVVRPGYREIGNYSEGLACVRSGMEFGYIDKKGEVRVPFQFSRAETFSCGRAAIFEEGKWGFIDMKGEQVIPTRFSKVRTFRQNRAAVRLGDKWGFIDPSGRMIVPVKYNEVGDFREGRAAVFVDGKGWGFVNRDGTIVIPAEFEAVGKFFGDVVPVRKRGKWGLMNAYGATMTLFKYDEIRSYHEGLAPVLVKRKMGLVNGAGETLLDINYDVVKVSKDLVQVETEDRIGYLNPQGKWIWQPQK